MKKYKTMICACIIIAMPSDVNGKEVNKIQSDSISGPFMDDNFAAKYKAIEKLKDKFNNSFNEYNVNLQDISITCDKNLRYGWECAVNYKFKNANKIDADRMEISSGYGANKETACAIALENAKKFEGWTYLGDILYIDGVNSEGINECSLLHRVIYK